MSNYIMDLRKIVGHRTLIQVGDSKEQTRMNVVMQAVLLRLMNLWKIPQSVSCWKKQG